VKEKLDRLWGRDWKSQAQKWFLLKFTGDEKEIIYRNIYLQIVLQEYLTAGTS
jgi:hypothetical protein